MGAVPNATGTPAPTSYQVKDGARALSCTSTPCTDSGQAAGSSHSYTVTSLYKSAWTAAAGAVGGTTNTKPTVAINSPTAGQTGVSKTATVTGTTSGGTSPGTITVTVTPTAGGAAVQTANPVPSGGNWSFALSGLADNTQYTIAASQASAGGTATATSVNFTTAATAAPTVAFNPVTAGTGHRNVFSGTTTSKTGTLTVKVYAGSSATGTAVQTYTATITQTGSSPFNWTVTSNNNDLTGGSQYTAQATHVDGGTSNQPTRTFNAA